MKTQYHTLASFIIFLGSLIIFTVGLSHQEIIGFESRFYLFAQEMLQHGFTGFPTIYQKFYPDYPVTAIALIVASAKILGGLNKLTAIFPSAVAAAITMVVTYWIGALQHIRLGIYAVLLLLLTNIFVIEARTISLDQYVTVITTISFYVLYSAHQLAKSRRLWWIPILLILGFSFRGPIGLVIPTGVGCVFYLCTHDVKRFLVFGISAILLLMLCVIGLLVVAHHVGGADFMQDVIRMQVSSRINDVYMPARYLYFTKSFGSYALTYPLVVAMLCCWILQAMKTRQKLSHIIPPLPMILIGWLLIIMLGLTIPSDKQMRYILPIAPPLALIGAYLCMVSRTQKYLFFLRRILLGFCCVLPTVGIIGLWFLSHQMPLLQLPNKILLAIFIGLQIIILLKNNKVNGDILCVGVAAATFLAVQIAIVEPINQSLNRTQAFVLQVEKNRLHSQAKLVFYREGPDGLPIKYLVHMPQIETPLFLSEIKSLTSLSSPAFIVMSQDNFQALPSVVARRFTLIFLGNIGREKVVVLYNF